MSRPVAVFDIDGTIFRSSLLIEITDALIAQKVFNPTIEKIYSREFTAWRNREASYDHYIGKVIEAFKQYLQGVKTSQLEDAADIVIGTMGRETYRYTRDLVKSLQKTHFLIAISKSPEVMVRKFAEHWGFDDYDASVYESKDGIYTGECTTDNRHKDVILRELVQEHHLDLKDSIGVGDSEGDIPLLSLVEHPIAFNPNSLLFAKAIEENWQVVVERKDVIYYYNKPDGSIIPKTG
jgi:HAD superfamily hydrolase (TIGR01490 family)